MCIALGVLLVSSVGLAWAPNLPVYITLRFFVGAASNGIVLTTFVLSKYQVCVSQCMQEI